MMNMKKINLKTILKTCVIAFAVFALVFSFTNTKTALASWDDWDYGGYDSGSDWDYYDYYEPNYDYYYDYYEPNYDYYYEPSYDYSYYPSYTPSYTPSYSSPSYYPTYTPTYVPTVSTPSYSSYTPSYIPTYVPTSTGGGSSANASTNADASANSNSSSNNTNTNTSSSNNNNVNNNVNTNNVNIVFGTPISGTGSTYYPPNNATLDGNCTISPSSVGINQDVRFSANATGGNGSYTYSWTGTDGVSASSQSFTGRYQYPGYKTATVTITSGGQSISRSCSVSVDQNYISNNNMNVYCVASPTNANIGQNVVWTAYATGGNGSYTYSWTGTDGLTYGNASAIQKVYTTSGYKTATVTAYSNGQSASATCSTNIVGGSVLGASTATVIREPNVGTPISGVFLSEVPATGIDGNLKVFLFVLGLALWSGFLGYMIVARNKKPKLALQANGNGSTRSDIHARIQAFKLANMQKKGLVK
jgi:hypothetical protein